MCESAFREKNTVPRANIWNNKLFEFFCFSDRMCFICLTFNSLASWRFTLQISTTNASRYPISFSLFLFLPHYLVHWLRKLYTGKSARDRRCFHSSLSKYAWILYLARWEARTWRTRPVYTCVKKGVENGEMGVEHEGDSFTCCAHDIITLSSSCLAHIYHCYYLNDDIYLATSREDRFCMKRVLFDF